MDLKKAHFWVPSVYFAEGLPAVITAELALVIFRDLDIPEAWNVFFTNLIGFLPLLLVKLFWSPVVDCVGTKRNWIVIMQFAIALFLGLAAAVCLQKSSAGFAVLLLLFMVTAFFSASHDVAADGFYIMALSEHEQALYTGLRSTFYRVASVIGNGGLLLFAGFLANRHLVSGVAVWAWVLLIPAVLMVVSGFWHCYVLPVVPQDTRQGRTGFFREFAEVFRTFRRREHLGTALAFLLLFRLGESQLLAAVKLFFLDEKAGMGLSLSQFGLWSGTCGTIALLAGGVFSGIAVSRWGFGKLLLPMALALNLPDLLYLILSFVPDCGTLAAAPAIVVEQFGYGFGFAGYMLFMVWYAGLNEKYSSSHFALMTVFMLAGLRVPAMLSAAVFSCCEKLSSACGGSVYQWFFVWVVICTIPGFACIPALKRLVPADFGCHKKSA